MGTQTTEVQLTEWKKQLSALEKMIDADGNLLDPAAVNTFKEQGRAFLNLWTDLNGQSKESEQLMQKEGGWATLSICRYWAEYVKHEYAGANDKEPWKQTCVFFRDWFEYVGHTDQNDQTYLKAKEAVDTATDAMGLPKSESTVSETTSFTSPSNSLPFEKKNLTHEEFPDPNQETKKTRPKTVLEELAAFSLQLAKLETLVNERKSVANFDQVFSEQWEVFTAEYRQWQMSPREKETLLESKPQREDLENRANKIAPFYYPAQLQAILKEYKEYKAEYKKALEQQSPIPTDFVGRKTELQGRFADIRGDLDTVGKSLGRQFDAPMYTPVRKLCESVEVTLFLNDIDSQGHSVNERKIYHSLTQEVQILENFIDNRGKIPEAQQSEFIQGAKTFLPKINLYRNLWNDKDRPRIVNELIHRVHTIQLHYYMLYMRNISGPPTNTNPEGQKALEAFKECWNQLSQEERNQSKYESVRSFISQRQLFPLEEVKVTEQKKEVEEVKEWKVDVSAQSANPPLSINALRDINKSIEVLEAKEAWSSEAGSASGVLKKVIPTLGFSTLAILALIDPTKTKGTAIGLGTNSVNWVQENPMNTMFFAGVLLLGLLIYRKYSKWNENSNIKSAQKEIATEASWFNLQTPLPTLADTLGELLQQDHQEAKLKEAKQDPREATQYTRKAGDIVRGAAENGVELTKVVSVIQSLALRQGAILAAQALLRLSKAAGDPDKGLEITAEILTNLEYRDKTNWSIRDNLRQLDPKHYAKIRTKCIDKLQAETSSQRVFIPAEFAIRRVKPSYDIPQLLEHAHPSLLPEVVRIVDRIDGGWRQGPFDTNSLYGALHLYELQGSNQAIFNEINAHLSDPHRAGSEALQRLILGCPEQAAHLLGVALGHQQPQNPAPTLLDKIAACLLDVSTRSGVNESVARLLLVLSDSNPVSVTTFLTAWGPKGDSIRAAMQVQDPERSQRIDQRVEEATAKFLATVAPQETLENTFNSLIRSKKSAELAYLLSTVLAQDEGDFAVYSRVRNQLQPWTTKDPKTVGDVLLELEKFNPQPMGRDAGYAAKLLSIWFKGEDSVCEAMRAKDATSFRKIRAEAIEVANQRDDSVQLNKFVNLLTQEQPSEAAKLIVQLSQRDVALAAKLFLQLTYKPGVDILSESGIIGSLRKEAGEQYPKIKQQSIEQYRQTVRESKDRVEELGVTPTWLLPQAAEFFPEEVDAPLRVQLRAQFPRAYYKIHLHFICTLSDSGMKEEINKVLKDANNPYVHEALRELIKFFPQRAASLIHAALQDKQARGDNFPRILSVLQELCQEPEGNTQVAKLLLKLGYSVNDASYPAAFLAHWGEGSEGVRNAIKTQDPAASQIITQRAKSSFAYAIRETKAVTVEFLGEAHSDFVPKVADFVQTHADMRDSLHQRYPQRFPAVELYRLSKTQWTDSTEIESLHTLFPTEEKNITGSSHPDLFPTEEKDTTGSTDAATALIFLAKHHPKQAEALISRLSYSTNDLAKPIMQKILTRVGQQDLRVLQQLKNYVPAEKRSYFGVTAYKLELSQLPRASYPPDEAPGFPQSNEEFNQALAELIKENPKEAISVCKLAMRVEPPQVNENSPILVAALKELSRQVQGETLVAKFLVAYQDQVSGRNYEKTATFLALWGEGNERIRAAIRIEDAYAYQAILEEEPERLQRILSEGTDESNFDSQVSLLGSTNIVHLPFVVDALMEGINKPIYREMYHAGSSNVPKDLAEQELNALKEDYPQRCIEVILYSLAVCKSKTDSPAKNAHTFLKQFDMPEHKDFSTSENNPAVDPVSAAIANLTLYYPEEMLKLVKQRSLISEDPILLNLIIKGPREVGALVNKIFLEEDQPRRHKNLLHLTGILRNLVQQSPENARPVAIFLLNLEIKSSNAATILTYWGRSSQKVWKFLQEQNPHLYEVIQKKHEELWKQHEQRIFKKLETMEPEQAGVFSGEFLDKASIEFLPQAAACVQRDATLKDDLRIYYPQRYAEIELYRLSQKNLSDPGAIEHLDALFPAEIKHTQDILCSNNAAAALIAIQKHYPKQAEDLIVRLSHSTQHLAKPIMQNILESVAQRDSGVLQQLKNYIPAEKRKDFDLQSAPQGAFTHFGARSPNETPSSQVLIDRRQSSIDGNDRKPRSNKINVSYTSFDIVIR